MQLQVKDESIEDKTEGNEEGVMNTTDCGEETKNKESVLRQDVVPMETEDDSATVVTTVSKSSDSSDTQPRNEKGELKQGDSNSSSELVMDDLGVDVVEEVLETEDNNSGNSNKCDSSSTDDVKQEESAKEDSMSSEQ